MLTRRGSPSHAVESAEQEGPFASLVYFAYVLLLCSATVRFTTLSDLLGGFPAILSRAATAAAAIAIFVKICSQRYSPVQLLTLAASAGLVLVSAARAGTVELLLSFGFIVAGQGLSVRKIGRLSLAVLGTLIPLIVLLARVGLISDIVWFRAGVARASLGFSSPNSLGRVLLQVALLWLLVRWKSFGIRDYVGLLFVAWIAGSLADSRTSFFLIVTGLALRTASHYRGRAVTSAIVLAARFAVLAAPAASLYFAARFDSTVSWQRSLDDALTGRLTWASYFFRRDGFSVLGQRVHFGTANSLVEDLYILDNAYARLAVESGLVVLALLSIGMFISVHKLARAGDVAAVSCILVFALFGLFERHIGLVAFNFTLLFMAPGVPRAPISGMSRQQRVRVGPRTVSRRMVRPRGSEANPAAHRTVSGQRRIPVGGQ